MQSDQRISVKDVWYTYPGNSEPTLRGIDLTLNRGEFLGIIGPTGAGKTTLCYCLNGIVPHSKLGELRGEVIVAGMDTREYRVPSLSNKVGLTLQNPEGQIFGTTVEEDTAFGPESYCLPPDEISRRIDWALSVTRMGEYRKKFPGALSGGQKQRVAIAGILAMQPEILVLDEPTSELDPIGKHEVFDVIANLRQKGNLSIIMVEHESEHLAQFADRIIVMNEGKIVLQGSPSEVFQHVDELRGMRLRPPQVSEFFVRLSNAGYAVPQLPLSVDEGVVVSDRLFRERSQALRNAIPNDALPPGAPHVIEGSPIIETKGLSHTYPDGTVALKQIDLTINERGFVGIIGQNGSGKTTLVKHFNRLLKPTEGDVLVDGRNTKELSVAQLSRKVGYCFQNPDQQIFEDTVYKEISFGLRVAKASDSEVRDSIKSVMAVVGLSDGYLERDPYTLGRGDRRKITVASVLVMKPKIIVVDEPTTGQDWAGCVSMMDILCELNRRGHTVVVISHDMRIIATYTRNIIVMSRGRVLLEGTTRDVFARTESLKEAFLEPPHITQLAQRCRYLPNNALTVDELVASVARERP